MVSKNKSIENIELVFKNYYQIMPKELNLSSIKTIIFDNIFWETTFFKWINILFNEFEQSLPDVLINKKSFSLSFEIVDNFIISDLNQKWLHKSGPTDVLSFPIVSKDDLKNNLTFIELGDIFLSLEVAIKQSNEFNNSIEKEVIWLACHGFLHLLGWDHQNQDQLDNMLEIQDYLISNLNLDFIK